MTLLSAAAFAALAISSILPPKTSFLGRIRNPSKTQLKALGNARMKKKERGIWRKQGPIGKLHNIVKYILATPQRTEEFEEKVRGEIERKQD
jgi:hypothetical protein